MKSYDVNSDFTPYLALILNARLSLIQRSQNNPALRDSLLMHTDWGDVSKLDQDSEVRIELESLRLMFL